MHQSLRFLSFLGLSLAACMATSQAADLASWYLPPGGSHDPAVPTPRQVLGYEVGEWHVSHDQLAAYVRAVAAAAPERTRLTEIGRTHEGRPLLHLVISAPANIARLDALREAHARSGRSDGPAPAADAPVVVWLGYSIHGDEASGSNAALLTAYHLAAGRGTEVERLLERAIVIVDPSFNPDGLQRFSTWANMHRGVRLNGDPNHREHVQGWPQGRFNHYWFDLNRDWLLTQHPESQARVREFQRWRPNVLADFHEMQSGATFFFQPGVPSRNNPLTPEGNLALTRALARHHAAAFDAGGSLYYSEEDFDDFYYGKGSTYPDLQGSVGILFEQASARGHLQDTANGPLSFPFAIRNQFWASLSTLRGAVAERSNLLELQRASARSARELARKDGNRAWVFGQVGDAARGLELARLLARHGIEVRRLTRSLESKGQRFEPGSAWVVVADQEQYRLIRTAFETVSEFRDTTFYDVSAWTLPLAFGLPYAGLGGVEAAALGPVEDALLPAGRFSAVPGAVAYAFSWQGYWAPRAVQRLQDAGVRVRAAGRPLTLSTPQGARRLERGAILVTLGQQSADRARVEATLAEVARLDGIEVLAVSTGLTAEGPDLGSNAVEVLRPIKPLLVVGEGVDPTEAGELWHLIDQRFNLPLTLVEGARLASLDLTPYTHILMVDLRQPLPDAFGERTRARLKAWVEAGGTLVASKGAAQLVKQSGMLDLEFVEAPKPAKDAPPAARRDYTDWIGDRDRESLAGAIFMSDLDLSHPLGWGYGARQLPVFRDHTSVIARPANRYASVAAYTPQPLISGYASRDNVTRIAGSAAVIADRVGQGQVIVLTDNPNFRAFWYGPSRLVLNALFMSGFIERTGQQ
jgi:hypothetical protein